MSDVGNENAMFLRSCRTLPSIVQKIDVFCLKRHYNKTEYVVFVAHSHRLQTTTFCYSPTLLAVISVLSVNICKYEKPDTSKIREGTDSTALQMENCRLIACTLEKMFGFTQPSPNFMIKYRILKSESLRDPSQALIDGFSRDKISSELQGETTIFQPSTRSTASRSESQVGFKVS